MTVTHHTQAGPTARERLARRIAQYLRHACRAKLGVTGDPERRAGEHARDGAPYEEMLVLFETALPTLIRALEAEFVDRYAPRLDNETGGGGGNLGDGPHFLYLMRLRVCAE